MSTTDHAGLPQPSKDTCMDSMLHDDSSLDLNHERLPHVRSKSSFGVVLTMTVMIAWPLSCILAYISGTHSQACITYTYDTFDYRTHDCGSTPNEAKTLGCHWDPVSFAWLPERCLDRDLADEFVNHTNWTLHADSAGTLEKTDAAFSEDDSPTYLTNANHALHCIFSWKRLHRALLDGRPYHSGLSLDHTHHCSEVLVDVLRRNPREIRTRALVIYPAC